MPQSGYFEFKDVPLANANEARWFQFIDGGHPLLRSVIHLGISAALSGAAQTGDYGVIATIEAGKLLDATGLVGEGLREELRTLRATRTEARNLALAGLYIVSAAVQATKLFTKYPVMNGDYTSPAGRQFAVRTVTAAVADSQSYAMGDIFRAGSVRSIHARIFKIGETGPIELAFAASLHEREGQERSIASRLRAHVDRDENSVRVDSGERQGEFAYGCDFRDFSTLNPYARAIARLVS